MSEDSFEKARKAFFGIRELSSVPGDAERDLEKVVERASEILRQTEVREQTNMGD